MDPLTGLSLGRIGLGLTLLARPDLGEVMSPPDGPRGNALITQAFASREIALGALTLLTARSRRRTVAMVGMFVDGADAVTTVGALQRGTVGRTPGYALAGIAGGAVVSGASALLRCSAKPAKPASA